MHKPDGATYFTFNLISFLRFFLFPLLPWRNKFQTVLRYFYNEKMLMAEEGFLKQRQRENGQSRSPANDDDSSGQPGGRLRERLIFIFLATHHCLFCPRTLSKAKQ